MQCDRLVATQVNEPGWCRSLTGVFVLHIGQVGLTIPAQRVESIIRSIAIDCVCCSVVCFMRSTTRLFLGTAQYLCSIACAVVEQSSFYQTSSDLKA
jgi:hypothetical protein